MNKFRLVNSCLFIAMLVACTFAYMAHINSKSTQQLHSALSEVGHQLIEERDVIVNQYAIKERKNFELTKSLVDIEVEAEKLADTFDNAVWFPISPNRQKIQQTLAKFEQRVIQTTSQLDMLIGVQVENQYALLMLLDIYEEEFSTHIGETQLDKHYVEFFSRDLVNQSGEQSESGANFLGRLHESDKKIELLTNELLDHNYFVFVEEAEHSLLDLAQNEARFTWLFVFVAVMLLVGSFLYQLQYRMHNLKQLNSELEAETDKAERAAKAKSSFLAAMSHELRTPMNGVLGISQLIAEETKEPVTKEHIKVILDSGQHLMTILNDILDFSKVEENKLELEKAPFHLEQVLTPVCSAIQPLIDEKSIELIVESDVPNNTEFTGDCARLRQILFNLAGNAVKFTNEGHVLIRTELNSEDKHLLIIVSDTGIGIAPDKQGRVFNSFEQADSSTTRRFGGTGLGLAIVKKLTELMGGSITLKSVEGVGTQFIVTLPIPWNESEKPSPQHTPVQTRSTQNLRILLAEDNRVNALVAKGFCEKLGHAVDVAENGLVAVEKAHDNDYDLILMDNHMPEMNGVEATRFIREKLGVKTLLFAYTADVFREAHDHFIAAGADHVLTKPLQRESFADALKQFSARLKVKQTEEVSPASNVLQLQRKPIENLRLTEEELSNSEMLVSLKEHPNELLDLLNSIITDFELAVDDLIENFMQSDFDSLKLTMHTTKGMALNLGLKILASQALELETQLKMNQVPAIEQLQMLINRLQVNIHQGHRLRDELVKAQQNSEQVL
ncbi:hybrid sensor histidine kinase/response regulator [Vibrio parahaemolyticus]|uniref:ATP-binding protein n=1 Tax=Vibrio parahaemolyticus TaxID=670 RepID=UPI00084BB44D|nr:ATP-binding protein [Vibrio parahaemolyticus]ODX83134.1 hybrid sensor histidine kinase/response regulator [Vibrio parahaemolyticus]ODX87225.1 hybrid sensor histidine kinase/response regulator [Vibrio parahaemolyticus]ODX93919.1 hybrid sensor histidine kinase/response regulator [Vibrio parahaemolyticus]ODX95219.1 hybrid sensor histidine kinase/response regulator [Vibrio parahaemolyticus]ODY01066.1 hybrid sensor histidine kinase/response regulator [Vibrio parahaemolyticus]